MEYVFLIFGTLIALNFSLMTNLSDPIDAVLEDETRIEIENMEEMPVPPGAYGEPGSAQ